MGPKASYNPDTDIPDLSNKVIFMTGGTAGLGKETITTLAKYNPEHIIFTGRNAKAAEVVVSETNAINPEVKVTYIECDQSSLASVQSAAKRVLELVDRLHIFIANAGIMGGEPGVSKDGYEIQFAINYLSHALFIKLLLPTMERTTSTSKDTRIVLLSSIGFRYTPTGGIVFESLKTDQTNLPLGMMQAKWLRYGQSKLAMVLLAQSLAQRHPLVTTVALHPGAIKTGLIEDKPTMDRWFLKLVTLGQTVPLNQGIWNTCWAATAPGGGQLKSGDMYEPVGVAMKGTKDSESAQLKAQLRDWTEKELLPYS